MDKQRNEIIKEIDSDINYYLLKKETGINTKGIFAFSMTALAAFIILLVFAKEYFENFKFNSYILLGVLVCILLIILSYFTRYSVTFLRFKYEVQR